MMHRPFHPPRGERVSSLAAVVLFEIAAAAALVYSIDATLTHAHQTGLLTGESVDGAPVYRLPRVDVVTSRSIEAARIAPEAESADASQVQTRSQRPAS